jgi:hypothetical protein
MSLNCQLTIKGCGAGARNGKLVHDKTGPVSDFLRDNQYYYRTVQNHLIECKKCDPQEALEGFLQNRNSTKKFGQTSQTLILMALSYEKRFAQYVKEETIDEFVMRGLIEAPECFINEELRLTDNQLLQALRWSHYAIWAFRSLKRNVSYPVGFEKFIDIVKHGIWRGRSIVISRRVRTLCDICLAIEGLEVLPCDEDLQKLAVIGSIMGT